ncbi:MAG: Type secretion system Vgr family protein, partial [Massilia sp.]|nr:Type secretion system Vgr family protein [Massilia sp.]
MGVSQVIAAGAALSAFSGNSQHNRLMRLDFPFEDGPPAILLPNKLVAREEVSRGFRVTVEVLSDEARIPLKMLMGRMVTISLVREDGSLRYFNGHITEFRFLRTDGGFAFYQMVLEPWLAFARLRRDNVSFHGKSVREITEETLKHYRQADWHMYPVDESKLTVANQHNETDYNHLHRRWEALGLHYWYEHEFGRHRLMISDNSFLSEPIDEEAYVIPFHDKSGSLEDDGIHEWTAVRRLGSGQTTLATFDYKNPSAQRADANSANQQGDIFPYEIYEDTGSYGFRMRSDGEQLATRRMEEADKDTQYFEAAGNDRSVLPGRTFKLGAHFSAEPRSREYDPEPRRSIDDRFYLILSVDHEAANNYQAGPGAPSHYENRFTCIRKDIRWRPGRNYNSEPGTYMGLHTAIVVGPAGAEIHTDGYGRVKLQFHWNRLDKYDENSSPWIRVMTPAAGNEFGQIRLPRVGEEVAVVYPDGNIDHPLILGALYNGKHMPPWNLPEQSALAGLRSRELEGGQRGNHLVLDDTAGKIQAQLKSDHECSQLSLGHIARIEDTTGRKDARGEGWELATNAWGVARAAQGMLITTEARQNAASHIKDLGETAQRLASAAQIQEQLASMAVDHHAQEKGQQDEAAEDIKAQHSAIRGAAKGAFPELAEPHLVMASPAGIELTTAQSTHIASGRHTAITSGKSLS